MGGRSLSITTKIVLLVASVTCITALSIGVTSYESSKEILIQNELAILEGEAIFIRAKLEEEIDRLKQDLKFLSLTPPIQGLIRAGNNGGIDPHDNSTSQEWVKRLSNIFQGMLKSKPHYYQIRFISAVDKGQEVTL